MIGKCFLRVQVKSFLFRAASLSYRCCTIPEFFFPRASFILRWNVNSLTNPQSFRSIKLASSQNTCQRSTNHLFRLPHEHSIIRYLHYKPTISINVCHDSLSINRATLGCAADRRIGAKVNCSLLMLTYSSTPEQDEKHCKATSLDDRSTSS